VYEQRDRQFLVWITNANNELVTLQARKTVAVWQPDDEGEIRLADGLVERAKRVEDGAQQGWFTLKSDNGEDWEWDDEHLYFPDVSNTPVGIQDPPPQASAQELRDAWELATHLLGQARNITADDYAGVSGLLQYLETRQCPDQELWR
jgi:hypothetical protein